MNIIAELKTYGGIVHEFEPGSWTQTYRFPETFIGFAGHFPNNPLLPAFIQICMARLLWESRFGSGFRLKTAKFVNPIYHDENIILRLSRTRAELSANDRQCAMMRLLT